jgi:hypothetical protein
VVGEEEKQNVFQEIVPNKTDDLIRDVFGNYVSIFRHILLYFLHYHFSPGHPKILRIWDPTAKGHSCEGGRRTNC